MSYYGIIPLSLRVGRSTSRNELGSEPFGPFKVATDGDGGGEFDGIVYMSVVAL
jgi:hypothetical protein